MNTANMPEEQLQAEIVAARARLNDLQAELAKIKSGSEEPVGLSPSRTGLWADRFPLLFEHAPNPIMLIDEDGRYLDANEAALRFLEYSRAELREKQVFDYVLPGRAEETPAWHKRLWQTGGVIETPYWVNGRTKVLELTIIPVDDPGAPLIIGMGRDITAQKQAIAALKQREVQFRTFLENVQLIGIMLDANGHIIFANDYFLSLCDQDLQEILGQNWFQTFIPPEERDEVEAVFRRTIAAGELPSHHENEIVLPQSGERRRIAWDNAVQFTAEGDVAAVTSLGKDVTQRRRMEAALRESETRFRTFMDHNPALAFIKDKDGRHLYGNKAVLDFLDYARGEFIGATVTDVFPPAIAAQMAIHDHEVITRGRVVTDEFHVPRTGGGKRWLRIIKFPLENAGETILGGMAFDVTRQRQAQQALQEREEQFRQLTETIQEVYWLRDIPSRRMLYVSPAYETIWGRPPQYLIDHPESFLEAVHPEDLPRVQKAVREQGDGRYFDEEFRIVRPDGTIRWVSARTFPVADAAGDLHRLAGVAADITERKQAETYLESTLDSSLNGIMALQAVRDGAGEIVDFEWVLVNEMAARMVGRSQEELIGKPLTIEMPGIREDGLFDLYVRVVETGETLDLEHYYDHDSICAWFQIVAVKLSDGFVVTFADITAYKEALDAAQAQRALANALVNTAEAVNQTLQLDVVLKRILDSIEAIVPHECANVALLDADKTYLHVAQFCSCPGESALLLPPLHAGDRLADQPPLQVMFNSGQPLLIAETAGDPRWAPEYAEIASFLGTPIIVEGAVIGFLNLAAAAPGFFTPEHKERLRAFAPQAAIAIRNAQLHESVQSQLKQLRQAQARLVQSEKLAAIGELVAGIAHELNNPLASIVLYSQLLQMEQGRETDGEALAQIVTQAQRASGIANNLLDFARQRPKAQEPISLNDLLRSAVDLLSYELRTHNIEVRLDLSAASPVIVGDVQQLQQVFVNLLNNAMGAQQGQDNGRVTIGSAVAAPRHLKDAPQVVRVTVQDNGPGMPTMVRKRAFDPFFTTKDVGQGTGLGLSVCHGIIGEHEGSIWVESEVGKGATFFIELPLVEAATPDAVANPAAEPAAPASAGDASPKRILVIDDEASIRLVLTRILGRHYEVEAVANGRVALEKVDAASYDLVICDVYMPGMGGLDFYEAWRERQLQQAQSTPVLFITGDTVSPYVKEQLADIDASFLHKPFDLDVLLDQVNALLSDE